MLMPSRVYQIEAPDSFGEPEAESMWTELTPFMFSAAGFTTHDAPPLLMEEIQRIAAHAGVPIVDAQPEALIVWWDGRCDRTAAHIKAAGARQSPTIMFRVMKEARG